MYAKIFSQIFDSSIAEDYEVRHVFEDLLKLADKDGVVDMTMEAIARRTNVPFEKVKHGIRKLSECDPESRSKEAKGSRIIPLDSHRGWGWVIVNYGHYRSLQDEESRRQYFRDAKRKQREGKPKKSKSKITPMGTSTVAAAGRRYEKELKNGGSEEALDKIVTDSLPPELREEPVPYRVEVPLPDDPQVIKTAETNDQSLTCERFGCVGHVGEDCPIPAHLDKGEWVRD